MISNDNSCPFCFWLHFDAEVFYGCFYRLCVSLWSYKQVSASLGGFKGLQGSVNTLWKQYSNVLILENVGCNLYCWMLIIFKSVFWRFFRYSLAMRVQSDQVLTALVVIVLIFILHPHLAQMWYRKPVTLSFKLPRCVQLVAQILINVKRDIMIWWFYYAFRRGYSILSRMTSPGVGWWGGGDVRPVGKGVHLNDSVIWAVGDKW